MNHFIFATASFSEIVFGAFVSICLGGIIAVVSFNLGRRFQREYASSTGDSPASSAPKILINIPEDLKPFPQLSEDGRVIAGERAVLWYSVYCKAVDDGYASDAADDADRAIRTVFGES